MKNCQFKLKFDTKSNSDMKNSMVMSIFSIFDQKYPFFGKFVPKIQNYLFEAEM